MGNTATDALKVYPYSLVIVVPASGWADIDAHRRRHGHGPFLRIVPKQISS